MKIRHVFFICGLALSLSAVSHAEINVTTGYSAANAGFTFQSVPAPSNNDAATGAQFRIVDGERDSNGGDLAVLHDGLVPSNEDHPSRNFFFRAGIDGGRILIDLGSVISVKHISSYSWHSGSRAPQVYKLYAADGTAQRFNVEPGKGTNPEQCGWTLVTNVDSRPKDGDGAGQHGVTISDSESIIGLYRYVLFDIEQTEDRDHFGNTFFGEFDVIDANGPAPASSVVPPILTSFETADGKYHFTVDATEAPDLVDWSKTELQSVVVEWYPRIVELLPSEKSPDEKYQAPINVTFRFRNDMRGTPASAAGTGVNLNAPWFRSQLKGEASGAVVHELVHVVQNYWGRRAGAGASATPGWIVEGIADYVRWFLFEPQSRGAEITKGNITNARYDSSYRVTGNFLNWLTQQYDKDIVQKLNAAAREGRYVEPIWRDWTGKTVQELGDEWKEYHTQRLNKVESR